MSHDQMQAMIDRVVDDLPELTPESPFSYPADQWPAVTARFWAKVDKSGECWTWQGALVRGGYGVFSVGPRKLAYVHRVSYQMANGAISPGHEIDHECLNRSCVRPSHLRQATHKQNSENRAGAQINSRSGIRGVHEVAGRWLAQVGHDGERFHLGTFSTAAEAEGAAVAKRTELFTHNTADRGVA